jgi:hypothetical protein
MVGKESVHVSCRESPSMSIPCGTLEDEAQRRKALQD